MNRLLGKILLLSVAIFWTQSSLYAEALSLHDNKKWIPLEPNSVEFPEGSDLLDIYKQLLSLPSSSQQIKEDYSGSLLAFRFRATNDSDHNNWNLTTRTTGIFNLRLYKVIPQQNGPIFVEQETIHQRVAAADVDLVQGESAEFVATYRTYENVRLGFVLVEHSILVEDNLSQTAWLGVATGIMLAVIIYNGFLLLSLQQRFHLFYLIFAISNGAIALFSVNFPPGLWDWAYQATSMAWGPYFRCLAPITTFAFTAVFLQTREKYPRIHRVFLSYFVGLGLIVAYYTLIGKPIEMNVALDSYFLLSIFIMLGAGVHAYRSGFEPAKYYLLGLTAFFLGIVVVIVYPFFVENPNGFFSSAHVWGQAAEMLLMSLALAAEIKILNEEKFRAVVSAETKSRLLRVISHDIRNPLAIIKGYGNILSQRMPDEVNIQKILRSANVIQEITELVQRSEVERKMDVKELVPVSIRNVFDELTFLFHRSALDKNIHLNFVVHPEDLKVIANEIILTNEILGNLISNAVKFSFSGSSIEVKAFAYGEKVRISIKDSGIGIPKGLLPYIFDKESNASRRGTSGELGAGFGLPIVYSFVQEFKGRIEVVSTSFEENDDQRGTEFIITLRRASSLSLVKVEGKATLPEQ